MRKLSKLFIVLSLVISSNIAMAQNHAKSSYVYTERAYAWTKPGYTWRDCAKIENSSDSFTSMEKLLETKEVCANRPPYLEAGDTVFLQPDGSGGHKHQIFPVQIGDVTHQKKFYEVVYDQRDASGNKTGTVTGWMSEDQLTQIRDPKQPVDFDDIVPLDETEVVTPVPSKRPEPPCPPGAQNRPVARDPVRTARTEAQRMQEIVNNNTQDVRNNELEKSTAEINRFMCLYRDSAISDRDFPAHLNNISSKAEQAAKDFKVPYSVLMCTMLIESGIHHKPRDRDEYQGYGQFGSAIVQDLSSQISKRSPYAGAYASYKARFPNASLSDSSIRQSADPTHAMAATAMMMRWIYQERLPASGCRNCSSHSRQNPSAAQFDLNRRDLYLMIAGYNYGPYSIKRYANRSMTEMTTSFPPPRETRNYMIQMDRCIQRGQETQFRVNNRTVAAEYNNRKAFCDRQYPARSAAARPAAAAPRPAARTGNAR